MASRAFFRCRDCGEPVVAGAYRCPHCGIDFPAGRPDTPQRREEPAGTDPRSTAGDVAVSASTPNEPAPTPDQLAGLADDLATALVPVTPAQRPATARAAQDEPGREAPGEDETGHVGPRQEGGRSAPSQSDASVSSIDKRPAGDGPGAPPQGRLDRAGADLRVAPGSERGSALAPDARLAVAPEPPRKRQRTRLVERDPTEQTRARQVPTARPRKTRGKRAGAMAGTIALAAGLIVAGVGAAVVFDGASVGTDDVGQSISAQDRPAALTVLASDGWVRMPSAGGLRLSANGRYRVRLDGEVYTVAGDRPVRVPEGGGRIEVRAVREPTVVEVRPLDP